MKDKTIITILSCIDYDLKNTYEAIRSGKPYQLYFDDLLEAKYDFLTAMKENGFNFDIEFIKERDKEKYSEE